MMFLLETHQVLMKQAKTRINVHRWLIGTKKTLISRFPALLLLVAVFACSGSIFLLYCWWYWRRRTNQVCYYWFSEIFMFFHFLLYFYCTYNKHCRERFQWCKFQLSCTILQFFAVQNDTTEFDLIDRFLTYGCCRSERLISFWICHT